MANSPVNMNPTSGGIAASQAEGQICENNILMLVFAQLVAVLEDSSQSAEYREQAASALRQSAADNVAVRDAIRVAGAIQPLVAMLSEQGASQGMRHQSAGALRMLSIRHAANCRAIVGAGAIPFLEGLLAAEATEPAAATEAAGTLRALDEHDAAVLVAWLDEHEAMDVTPVAEPEAEWELEEREEPARQAVDDARRRALEARQFVERKRLEMQKMAIPAVLPDERERHRRTDVSTASENWLEVQRMTIRAQHAKQERDKVATEAAAKHAELAAFLQQQGFRGPDLPKTKLFKKTYPLHCAVVEGNPRIVGQLLREGVDITRKDSTGKTALQISLQNGNSQIVEMLHKATHLARSPSAEVLPTQAKESVGRTPYRGALGGA